MANKKSSPFEFWFPPQKEQDVEEDSVSQQPGWSDVLHEAGKTWQSISPLIQPFFSKFKK